MTVESITPANQPDAELQPQIEFRFELPPFPTTASQLVAELNNSDVQVPRVTQLIECEPTIGSRVLSLANSPIYGTSRPISTISHAIVILGFRSVTQLALTVATGSVFSDDASPCAEARQKTYSQSLAVATVARLIASKTQAVNADEAFLSGVMHDVGKLILFDSAGATYSQMIADHPTGDTTAAEHEQFGTTHPELGHRCGKKWGLPHSINQAISNHHLPLCEVSDPLSETLITADYLARKWQIGFEPQGDFDAHEHIENTIVTALDSGIQDECVEQFAAIREICLT